MENVKVERKKVCKEGANIHVYIVQNIDLPTNHGYLQEHGGEKKISLKDV